MRRQVAISAGITLLIITMGVLHERPFHANLHVAMLFALPVLLAALTLHPRLALVPIVLAVALHSEDSWVNHVPLLTWLTESASLFMLGGLGVLWAQRRRRESQLLAENVRPLAQVRQTASELEEAYRERERFIGMVSHETKSILTVMSGYV